MDTIVSFVTFLILLSFGYFVGTRREKEHYKSIEERERKYLNLPAVTFRTVGNSPEDILDARLVAGSTVVSVDYFKRFLAGLRNIVGGRVTSYETLLDRARREATLRMKEAAAQLGAHYVLNVRLETASMGKEKKGSVGSVEVIVYGTAVKLKG